MGKKESRCTFVPKFVTDIPAVVVLGKVLQPDGNASPTLQNRMVTASDVYLREREKNSKTYMIVSGGKVQQNENYSLPSEAEVMRTMAILNFVPKSSVVMETNSKNTIENAINTRDVLEDLGVTKVIIITSDYHMQRARRVFEIILSERGKVKDYQISGVEDKSPISQEERKKEHETENAMLSKLDSHIALYFPR